MSAQLAAAGTTDAEVLRVAAALGFLGFFCLVGAVVWGIATAVGAWPGAPLRDETIEQGHLAWAVAGLVLIAAHLLVHTLRPVAPLSWVDGFVPFAAGGWIVAAGVAGWLSLLAAAGSVLVRSRMRYGTWLAVHRAAYAGFGLMALHVVAAAADDRLQPLTWVGVAALAALLAVGSMIALRVRAARTTPARAAWGAGAVTLPRVDVDHRRCARHGLCAATAPGTFLLGTDRRVHVSPVPDRDAAQAAARLCPAQAIRVDEAT